MPSKSTHGKFLSRMQLTRYVQYGLISTKHISKLCKRVVIFQLLQKYSNLSIAIFGKTTQTRTLYVGYIAIKIYSESSCLVQKFSTNNYVFSRANLFTKWAIFCDRWLTQAWSGDSSLLGEQPTRQVTGF